MWEPIDSDFKSWHKYSKLLLARKTPSFTFLDVGLSRYSDHFGRGYKRVRVRHPALGSTRFRKTLGRAANFGRRNLAGCRADGLKWARRADKRDESWWARRYLGVNKRDLAVTLYPSNVGQAKVLEEERRENESGGASVTAPWLCHHPLFPPAAPPFSHSLDVRAHLTIPCSFLPPLHTHTHLFPSAFLQRSYKDKNLILCLLVGKNYSIQIAPIEGRAVGTTFGIYIYFFYFIIYFFVVQRYVCYC